MTDEGRDRRRQRRRPLALDVTALAGADFDVAPAKLVDLSLGGAQVDLDAALEPGERMSVSFDFFDGEPGWVVEGQVRWRDPTDGGYTYGVAFVDVAPENERQLRRLLPDIIDEQGGAASRPLEPPLAPRDVNPAPALAPAALAMVSGGTCSSAWYDERTSGPDSTCG